MENCTNPCNDMDHATSLHNVQHKPVSTTPAREQQRDPTGCRGTGKGNLNKIIQLVVTASDPIWGIFADVHQHGDCDRPPAS